MSDTMAGRSTPGSIFSTKCAVAIKAPVLPALTMASTLWPANNSQQRLMELSGFLRRATTGDSSMPMA